MLSLCILTGGYSLILSFFYFHKVFRQKKSLQRHRFFETLLNDPSEIVFVFNTGDRKFLFVNKTFCDLLGYTRRQIHSMELFDIIIPLAKNNYAKTAAHLNVESHISLETHLLSSSSQVIPVDMAVRKQNIDGVECYYVLARVSEKRKDAESELQKNRQFLHSIINHSSSHIFAKDPEGRYLLVNDAWKKYNGLTDKEVIGKKDFEIFNPRFAKMFREEDSEIIKNSKPCNKSFSQMKNNETVYLQTEKYPIYDSEKILYAICGITTDMTEIRKKEARVKMSEGKMRFSLASMGAWYFHYEFKNRIIKFDSPLFFQKLGYDRNSFPENIIDFLKLMHPSDIKRHRASLTSFGRKKTDRMDMDIRIKNSRGEWVWIEAITKVTEKAADGSWQSCSGVCLYIEKRKQLESDLRQARIEAEKATRAKSDFLANMSHEIRTPMNAIIGFNDLLTECSLDERQKDYVHLIDLSAKNLLGIINDILDFSKIEARKLELESIDFDFDEILENISQISGFRAFSKGLEFIVSRSENIPRFLNGDPVRLNQILTNVISNAVKFTHQGEIDLSIDAHEERDDSLVLHFSIRDTGIGMSESQIEKIFNAFSQADSSITRKFGGTGLGMSITRNLVQLMNGRMNVESEPGKGTVFHFYLNFGKAVNSHLLGETLPSFNISLNILLAVDNDRALHVLSEYIRSFDVSVKAVSSAVEVYEQLDTNSFDILFLDSMLNDTSAVSIKDKILGTENKKSPFIVLLTSHCDSSSYEDQQNFEHVISKPVSRSSLYNCFQKIFHTEIISMSEMEESTVNCYLDEIRGSRILLVEDNEINQQVAGEMLRKEGFYVDFALSGLKALQMISRENYDLILMDLQMPYMDGFTAVRIIRQDARFISIPVIALSADALEGIRNKVKNAGMNDYLAKPVIKKELLDIIVKWIPPRNNSPVTGRYDTSVDYSLDSLVSFQVSEACKRFDNDKIFYAEVLDKFRKSNMSFCDNLKKQLMGREYKDAVLDLHSLKGSSANLGALDVSHRARNLEVYLKETDSPDSHALKLMVMDLVISLDRCIVEIEGLPQIPLRNRITDDIGRINKEELVCELRALKEEIGKFDTSSEDTVFLLKPRVEYQLFLPVLEKMHRHLKDYEYHKAEIICDELIGMIDEGAF